MERFIDKDIPIVLGDSVSAEQRAETVLVSLRYAFRPASVDDTSGHLVKAPTGDVTLTFRRSVDDPQSQQSDSVTFKGTSARPSAMEYMLFFDGEKFILERAEEIVSNLRYQAPQEPCAPVSGRSRPSTIEAFVKKRKKQKQTGSRPKQKERNQDEADAKPGIQMDGVSSS
jgi:hypothetical protein